WATCGRSWGFRFLLTGELTDPLPVYDRVFAGLEDKPAAWRRAAGKVALRFPDPLGRKDAAGRVIPHEFVVSGDLADRIESVEVETAVQLVAGRPRAGRLRAPCASSGARRQHRASGAWNAAIGA